MPKEPSDFNCRDAGQVLRLRLRDWMWPTAIAIVVVIIILGYSSGTGTYKIGSLTYYVNTFGPLIILVGLFCAGLQWCLLGRLRPHDTSRCGQCNYPLDWSSSSQEVKQCPECGIRSIASLKQKRVPFMRLFLDVPGLLAVLFPIFVIIVLLIASFGVINFD